MVSCMLVQAPSAASIRRTRCSARSDEPRTTRIALMELSPSIVFSPEPRTTRLTRVNAGAGRAACR